jgi:methylmalonyl-CoA/ethylmalonyl-CoA epimerase
VEALRIHHLGVAVEDLDEAVETYERLFGATVEHRATVEDQGVEAASIRLGESRVELLASLGEETHHVAYEVADLPGVLRRLLEGGVELIDEAPREGLFGLQVAFVHPDSVHGVLSELVDGH